MSFNTGTVYDECIKDLKLKYKLIDELNKKDFELWEDINSYTVKSIKNIVNSIILKYYDKRATILAYKLNDDAETDNFKTSLFHRTMNELSKYIAYDYYYFLTYKDRDLVAHRTLSLSFLATPDNKVVCTQNEFTLGDSYVNINFKFPHYFNYKAKIYFSNDEKCDYDSNVILSKLSKKKYFKYLPIFILDGWKNCVYKEDK